MTNGLESLTKAFAEHTGETGTRIVDHAYLTRGPGTGQLVVDAATRRVYYYQLTSTGNVRATGVAVVSTALVLQFVNDKRYENVAVDLGYEAGDPNTLKILRINNTFGVASVGGNTPAEQISNSNAYPVPANAVDLRSQPTAPASQEVQVGAGNYLNDSGDIKLFSTDQTANATHTLTAQIATLTSGQHAVCWICLDVSTGKLDTVLGTASSAAGTLPSRKEFNSSSAFNAITVTSPLKRIVPIYLYYGQTEIVEADYYRAYDARHPFNPAGSSGGSGITQLTGDVTAGPGSGSQAATLATVNSNVGSYTNASITVNGKGLITAASSGTAPVTNVTATSPLASSGGATPDISLSGTVGPTHGGTGLSDPTAHDQLIANGSGNMQLLSPGALGSIEVSDGTDFAMLPVGTNGQGLIANDAKTDGLYYRDILYPQNFLVNGGFDFNSRNSVTPGFVTYNDGDYSVDNWYVLTNTGAIQDAISTSHVPTNNSAGHSGLLKNHNGTNHNIGRAQIVENARTLLLRGRTVTFQGYLDCGSTTNIRYAILEWDGTADAPTKDVVNNWSSSTYTPGNFFISTVAVVAVGVTAATSGTVTFFSVSGDVSTSANNLYVVFWSESALTTGVTLALSEAQLVDGADPVPWMPLPLPLERLRCVRFLQVWSSTSGASVWQIQGHMYSGTHAYFVFRSPVPMIAAPSLVATASDWEVTNTGAGVATPTAIALGTTTTEVLFLDVTVTLNIGTAVFLRGKTASDRYLIFTAELGV